MSEKVKKPQTKTFGRKGKVLHAQAREVVANVIQFMRNEAENYQRGRQPEIPLAYYKQRVCAATGISDKLYRTIVKESASIAIGEAECFSTPRQKGSKKVKKEEFPPIKDEREETDAVVNNFLIVEALPMLPTIKDEPQDE